jgi:predicted transcriptional regulator
MTDRNINVHIGSLTDMGERFKAAWKDAEAGLPVTRDHVTFLSLESFMAAMSPRRLDLMRHLRREGAMSVRKLAQGVARDYKSVHREVALLIAAGLIERRATDEVAVAWDRAVTALDLAA